MKLRLLIQKTMKLTLLFFEEMSLLFLKCHFCPHFLAQLRRTGCASMRMHVRSVRTQVRTYVRTHVIRVRTHGRTVNTYVRMSTTTCVRIVCVCLRTHVHTHSTFILFC